MKQKNKLNKSLKGNKVGKSGKIKTSKCLNSNPEKSKWGDWAPSGGCNNKVFVTDGAKGRLCWKCTHAVLTKPRNSVE